MREILANPYSYALGAIYTARTGIRLLREVLDLRNEWYRRER